MQAIVLDAPMQFSLRNVPDPSIENGGGLARVLACGLCGSDVRTLRFGHRNVKYPWILGHEFCAEILYSPEDIETLQPGVLVSAVPVVPCGLCPFCVSGRPQFCQNYKELAQHWPGAFAEKIALPAGMFAHGSVLPLPPSLSPALGTIAEPLAAVVHAQELASINPGDTVVVIGSGPVGCMHIALAKHSGAGKTFLVDIGDQRLALAEPYGADIRINSTKQEPFSVILPETKSLGADVVIVAASSPEAVLYSLKIVRKGGAIILFAGLPSDLNKLSIDINDVHYRGIRLLGSSIYAPRHHQTALNLLSSGIIQEHTMITTYPLADFEQGVHAAMENRILKAVFIP